MRMRENASGVNPPLVDLPAERNGNKEVEPHDRVGVTVKKNEENTRPLARDREPTVNGLSGNICQVSERNMQLAGTPNQIPCYSNGTKGKLQLKGNCSPSGNVHFFNYFSIRFWRQLIRIQDKY